MLNHLDNFNDFSEKDYEPCSKIPYIYDKILEDKESPFYDIINDERITYNRRKNPCLLQM